MIERGESIKKSSRKAFSPEFRKYLMEKFNCTCSFCGKTDLKSEGKHQSDVAVIDHILPLIKGGTNDESNLQILCRSCNTMKGSMSMDEFVDFVNKKEELDKIFTFLSCNINGLNSVDIEDLLKTLSIHKKYTLLQPIYKHMVCADKVAKVST